MHAGILGTLELVDGGRAVPVSGRRRRAVLAYLLVNAGRAVAVDRICAAIWPDDDGERAARTVKTYIWQFRRLFSEHGEHLRVETDPNGYRLQLGSGVLDRDRFEAGLRRASEAGGAAERLKVLDAALSLWRGPALEEFRGLDWADQEGARLDLRRLAARTQRAEVLLELGRDHDAVADLEVLAAEQPLDEHVGVLRATALAGNGRPVEALRVLSDLRRRLAEDAGLEPGPAVLDLEVRILERGPVGAVAAGAGRAVPGRVDRPTAGNLPLTFDRFVGRDDEVRVVGEALDEHRLVTLTGTGGAGKTRLAVEVAGRRLPAPPDGVWLIELAPLADPAAVTGAVAAVLGVGGRHSSPLERSMVEWLGRRDVLLVLDNCEHLLDAVGHLALTLLETCPGVRMLATSRERLGIRGERVVPVPSLTLGDAELLFDVRARAAAPDACLDDRALVAAVCGRLDRLPLAIELAAARLRSVSLLDLAGGLDDRFATLGEGRRHDSDRHRTLEAVVDWSYDLLDPAERCVFERCSAFVDSFSLTAAVAVAGSGVDSPTEVRDVLGRLVDKSLLVRSPDRDGHTRYQMAETVRHHAAGRLRRRPEALHHTRSGLLRWALDEVGRLERAMRTPDQDAALRAAVADRANHREALAIALADDDPVSSLRLVSAVPLAPVGERRALISRLVPPVDRDRPEVAAQAYLTQANLAFEQGDWAESVLAGREGSRRFLALGQPRLAAWCRYMQAFGCWGAGDLEAADALAADVLDTFRLCRDEFGLGYALWLVSQRETDLERADRLAAEAEGLLRALGASVALAHDLEGRGLIALQRGRIEQAGELLGEALRRFAEPGNAGCAAHCLEAIGALLVVGGAPLDHVSELAGAADSLRAASGHHHRPWELRGRYRVDHALAGRWDEPAVRQAELCGRGHDLVRAVERAQALLARPRT